MIKLTAKEEEVMEKIWQIGKGYLTHEAKGRGYIYSPIVAQNDYGKSKFSSFVDRYFDHDYMKVVSTLVSDEKVSREELLQFLDELKSQS